MNTTRWNVKGFANSTVAATHTSANAQFDIKDETYQTYKPYHSPIDPEGGTGYNFHPADLSRDVRAALFFFIRGHR